MERRHPLIESAPVVDGAGMPSLGIERAPVNGKVLWSQAGESGTGPGRFLAH